MKHQFGPLTQQESFFGVNRTNAGTSNFVPKAVVPPSQFEVVTKTPAIEIPSTATTSSNLLITPTAPTISANTNTIELNEGGILLSNFLWKYRWEIGITTAVVVGVGIYLYTQKKKEEDSSKKFCFVRK